MLNYMSRAIPLEDLTKKEGVSEEDIHFVKRVEDIRRFAMDELGLRESKNYTRYVELDRDYLAAVVSACAADSFTRHEWWFPVIGRVPYKGFFNIEDARKERAKLEKKGLDVWIRSVDAFSTLGWFKDPLYSYMKNYAERDLAELIIHELLHATVFIKNHVQFNEELAQFVGMEGARLYMEKVRGRPVEDSETVGANAPENAEAGDSADVREDRAVYHAFIHGLIAELDEAYKSDISGKEKLARKAEIINGARARFEENYDGLFKTDNYRNFSSLPVNNAYLELFRLYNEEDSFFKDLYEKSGNDLPKFIAAAKTLNSRRVLKQGDGNPKEALEQVLYLSHINSGSREWR